jgi:hypothetical protein
VTQAFGGLRGTLAAFGWAISPDKAQAIVAFAVAAVGLVHVLFPENGRAGDQGLT